MTKKYFNGLRSSPKRPWDLVVPTDTASIVFQRDPLDPISTFVDKVFAPEYNLIFPGVSATRKTVRSRRSIFFVLGTSSALATAPSLVQSSISTLSSKNTQAYLLYSTANGDCWIVGNTSDAVRHGGFDLLRRMGLEYYGPHPDFRVVTPRGSWELSTNEIIEPAYESFAYFGNGGFGSGVNPPVPNRALQITRWQSWWAQKRMPIVIQGFGDGDKSFTTNRQDELRNNHTMLAWSAADAKRGHSDTGNWPAAQFSGAATNAKLCCTHHGTSGAYPSPPAGPDVWTGITHRTEDATHYAPGGPLTPDPGPDTAANPSTAYTWFGGGVKMHAEHHRDALCVDIQTYGTNHALTRFISSQTNDGVSNCECTGSVSCVNLLRNGPYAAYLTPTQQTQDSSFSDRFFHFLNETQKYIENHFTNALLPGTSTHFCPGSGALAYAQHAAPPTIPIHANSIVVVLPLSANDANMMPSELADAWVAKRASNPWGAFKLGIQPQWMIENTNLGAFAWPSPIEAAALNKDWIAKGYTLNQAQTGHSALTSGVLWWLLARQVWEPNLDPSTELDKYFSQYGPVSALVRALYARAWQWWGRNQHEIGTMCRETDAMVAALAATPDPIGVDPLLSDSREAVRKRLDNLRAMVHAQRLALDYYDAHQFWADGQLDASGPGAPPNVTVVGARTKSACFGVEVQSSTTYRWTRNYDHPTIIWEETGVTIVPGATHTLGDTNCVLSFPATGTYATGQIYSQVGPVNRMIAARDALSLWDWRILQKNAFPDERIARVAWLDAVSTSGAPFPLSSAAEGSSPPAVTIGNPQSYTSPSAGTLNIDIEVTTAGTQTTMVFKWRRNGGSYVTGVTGAASLVLTAAGVTALFPTGTYSVGHKWHMTFDPNIEKWDENNPASSANWSAITEPTRSEIDAAITADIAAYVPVAGVTRYVTDDTSWRSFNMSVATTLHDTPQCDTPQRFVVKTPGTCTIKLNMGSKTATPGAPVRLILKDMVSGAVLQTQSYTPPAGGTSISNFVISQPAGVYQLYVAASLLCLAYVNLSVPENVGCVWHTDMQDAPAYASNGFGAATHWYFYVPTGQTKIVMSFDNDPRYPVVFYDPVGNPVTTTRVGLSQWVCDVPSGQDNAAWSFSGLYSRNSNQIVRLENCPSRISPSRYQLLIP